MSDGTVNLPVRSTPPDSPTAGRYKIWVSSVDGKPKITDENGVTLGFESLYGSDLNFDTNDLDTTNNTTTFQNYLTIPYAVSTVDANARYEVTISFVWGYSSAANDFRGQFTINGVQFGEEFRQEPKDGGTDQRHYTTFNFPVTGTDLNLLNGFIGWNYASSTGGNIARMFYCYLKLKRLS